ncbi:MAG: hypothetical protein DMG08_30025, partial [Acidobacteria bacterium]
MSRSTNLFSLVLVPLLTPTAFAQQFNVVNSNDKELRRSAHRMRITPERLRQARRALEEATGIVGRMDPVPVPQLDQLSSLWPQVHGTAARERLEQLYGVLRRAAADAPDEAAYRQQSQAAQALLASLSEVDANRAAVLGRSWPEPPSRLGQAAAEVRSNFETELGKQSMRRIGMSNPEKLVPRLEELERSGTLDPMVSGRLAMHLTQSGRREDALHLVDHMIGQLDQAARDPRLLSEYMSFLSVLPMVDPERAVTAATALARVPKDLGGGPAGMTLQMPGGQRLDLTSAETAIVRMVQNGRLGPALALRVIDANPDLKTKLDGIGGIDALYGPNAARPGPSPETISAMSGNYVGPYFPSDTGPVIAKIRNLVGADPASAVKKLTAEFQPEHFQQLLRAAQQLSFQDPDLASTVLESARGLLGRVEPLEKRAQLMTTLIRIWSQVEGEVEPKLYREGFVLVDDLRQAPRASEQTPAVGAGPSRAAADNLERTLVAEYARDDFEA